MTPALTPVQIAAEQARLLLVEATPGEWSYRQGSEDAVQAGDLHTPILRADMATYHPDAARMAAQKVANLKLASLAPSLARSYLTALQSLAAAQQAQASAEAERDRLRGALGELAHRWGTLAKGIYFDLPDDSTAEKKSAAMCQISDAYRLEQCAAQIWDVLNPQENAHE